MEQIENRAPFTGVFVEGEDAVKLQKMFLKNMKSLGLSVPNNWKEPEDYHMTVKLGYLKLGRKMAGDIGAEVDLVADSIGFDENAVAVGVTGYMSKNIRQHITMLFKEVPSDSNKINPENWIKIPFAFSVKGVIREI